VSTNNTYYQNFGSGRYLLILRDGRTLLRKHTVTVHNPAHPPKVDESEVQREPGNESYFCVWAKQPSNTEGA
jgi:hypothetical protein